MQTGADDKKKGRLSTLAYGLLALALLVVSIAAGVYIDLHIHASTQAPVTYVWMFGYVGSDYYPQTELGLSPSQVIATAATISNQLGGRNRLAIVSAVDVYNGAYLKTSDYPAIASYVISLHQYANLVYGRLDLQDTNLTATSQGTVYTQVGIFVNNLGLDGVWFDHVPEYYNALGQSTFNTMMQNLVTEFPNTLFMLNEATPLAPPIPLSGTTWSSRTYVTPTIASGTYNGIPKTLVTMLNQYWSGRVIVHWDADAGDTTAPMGVLANQNTATEMSAIGQVASTGLGSLNFAVLYPVVGAWTNSKSSYHGALYNSMNDGTYSRGTLASLIHIMQNPDAYASSTAAAITTTSGTTSSNSTSSSASSITPSTPTASMTVMAIDQNGKTISGIPTTVERNGSSTITSGYTTYTYTATTGQTYTVCVSNTGTYFFEHWADGTTNSCEAFTSRGNTAPTAYFIAFG